MLKDLIDSMVNKVNNDKELDVKEMLAFSLLTSGNNPIVIGQKNLKETLDNSISYSKFRNNNTILSTDNFFIGELFKVEIEFEEKTKSVEFLTNIELIALRPSTNIEKDSLAETFLSLSNIEKVDILKNSFDLKYLKEITKISSLEEFKDFVSEKSIINNSTTIIKINNVFLVFTFIKGIQVVYEMKIFGESTLWVNNVTKDNINLMMDRYIRR